MCAWLTSKSIAIAFKIKVNSEILSWTSQTTATPALSCLASQTSFMIFAVISKQVLPEAALKSDSSESSYPT